MADLFGRSTQNIVTPLTADQAFLTWSGTGLVTSAVQVSISYNQPVNRRRTIGNQDAVIFAGMPSGQIAISQLMTVDANTLFNGDGWAACKYGQITLTMAGCGGSTPSLSLTAMGCIVTSFQTSLESESLTIIDNVVIEFLQLFNTTGS